MADQLIMKTKTSKSNILVIKPYFSEIFDRSIGTNLESLNIKQQVILLSLWFIIRPQSSEVGMIYICLEILTSAKMV